MSDKDTQSVQLKLVNGSSPGTEQSRAPETLEAMSAPIPFALARREQQETWQRGQRAAETSVGEPVLELHAFQPLHSEAAARAASNPISREVMLPQSAFHGPEYAALRVTCVSRAEENSAALGIKVPPGSAQVKLAA